MKLTISKSKNAEQLYITKSIRVSKNKTTSKIVVKLGSMASLLPKHDNDRDKVIAWAKQAGIYTEAEDQGCMSVYLSSYTRTEITDALHDTFGFRTDNEFISEKTTRKIFKTVEKG